MRPPRLRVTLREMMFFVAVSAVAVAGWVKLFHESARRRYLESARFHARSEKVSAVAILQDLRNARVCLRYAVEGRPMQEPLDLCGNMGEWGRHLGVLVASDSAIAGDLAITDQRANPLPRWAVESRWWVSEAFRDAARTAWHNSMKRKYEAAAANPLKSLTPDPPYPF